MKNVKSISTFTALSLNNQLAIKGGAKKPTTCCQMTNMLGDILDGDSSGKG